MAGYGFVCFSEDTRKLIFELFNNEQLTKDQFMALGAAKNYNHLMQILNDNFAINESLAHKIHWHCYMQAQEWFYANPNKTTSFNNCQNQIWQLLMKNNGILTRKELRNTKNGLTKHQTDTNTKILIAMGLIIDLKLRKNFGGFTVYLISPEYVNEVKNG